MKHFLAGVAATLLVGFLFSTIGPCGTPWDDAEAASLRARSDSLTVALTAERARSDSLLAANDTISAVVDSVSDLAASAGRRATIASNRHNTLADSLIVVLDGSQEAQNLVRSIVDAHEASMAEKDEEVRLLVSNVDRLRAQNELLAEQLARLSVASDSAVAALTADRDFWESAARDANALNLFGIRLPKWAGFVGGLAAGIAITSL